MPEIISGNKLYAVINKVTGLFAGMNNFGFSHEEGQPEPTPTCTDPNIIFVYVTSEDLGELTLEEFRANKKPILVSQEFDSWGDRYSAPEFDISENPVDDGSNTPTITLDGALASSNFRISFSRPVSCNLSGLQGTFDGGGNTSFKIKVIGQGGLSMTVEPRDHSNFKAATYEITVDAAPF